MAYLWRSRPDLPPRVRFATAKFRTSRGLCQVIIRRATGVSSGVELDGQSSVRGQGLARRRADAGSGGQASSLATASGPGRRHGCVWEPSKMGRPEPGSVVGVSRSLIERNCVPCGVRDAPRDLSRNAVTSDCERRDQRGQRSPPTIVAPVAAEGSFNGLRRYGRAS